MKPGASSQTRGRMIRTKWRRERKKIQIELTYYQPFTKDSGPQRGKGKYVIKLIDFVPEPELSGLSRQLVSQIFMYLLTEWEGRTGKYLARGHGVRTERSEVRAP